MPGKKLEAEVAGGLYESEDPYTQQQLRMDYADRLKRIKSGVDTYWLSQPLEVAVGHKHSLYVEGGDKRSPRVTGVLTCALPISVSGWVSFCLII